MKLSRWTLICACALAASCAEPAEPDPTDTTSDAPSKDEVRSAGAKNDDGTDLCEEYGWYGDGICDSFCPLYDSDCDDEEDPCAGDVIPQCEPGEILVSETTCEAAGDDCTTVTEICDVVGHCLYVGEFCPQVVGTPAACPSGTSEVDQCETIDCEIARGSGDQCTDIAFCEPTFQCAAVPACGPTQYQTSSADCATQGSLCGPVSMCGQTIHCAERPEICPQVVGTPPSCDSGETEVNGCIGPQFEDGTCRAVFGTGDQCANMIYCAG